MKTTFLIDEPKAVTKLEIPVDSQIDWGSARIALGLSYPTMRQYRRILASSTNPNFIGVKEIERLAKYVAWCNYGTSVLRSHIFNRRSYRALEMRKQADNEIIKYGINWIPIWNKLASAVLMLEVN